MNELASWWRARTNRERRLIQVAAALVFAILLPGWIYLSASTFREQAAADLAGARRLSTQVEHLREVLPAPGEDNSVRGRVLAAAQSCGLTPTRLEQGGAGRLRVVFEAADSVAVYRWIDAAGRQGVAVTRTTIMRLGASDQVNAEFEVGDSA